MLDVTLPPPSDEIWKWLHNMGDNWAQFKAELNLLDLRQDLEVSPDVLGSEALLKLLCKLPPAEELGGSLSQMRALYGRSDVWNALGAMLAYMIKPSTTHQPKYKNGKRLPGAPDLWQAPYLGVVDVFVTDDELMLGSISEISGQLRRPRWVACTTDFFERLQADGLT